MNYYPICKIKKALNQTLNPFISKWFILRYTILPKQGRAVRILGNSTQQHKYSYDELAFVQEVWPWSPGRKLPSRN